MEQGEASGCTQATPYFMHIRLKCGESSNKMRSRVVLQHDITETIVGFGAILY